MVTLGDEDVLRIRRGRGVFDNTWISQGLGRPIQVHETKLGDCVVVKDPFVFRALEKILVSAARRGLSDILLDDGADRHLSSLGG